MTEDEPKLGLWARLTPVHKGIIVAVAAGAGLVGAYEVGRQEGAPTTTAAPTDQDRLQSYKDQFLSGDVVQFTTREVRERDFPTTKGTTVKQQLAAGGELHGRFVKGVDPTTRWFKTSTGYVWDGNLTNAPPVPEGPGEAEMRFIIANSFSRNEMISGCMVDAPDISSISVLSKGAVQNGVYPYVVQLDYQCRAGTMLGQPMQQRTKLLKYFFKQDAFGVWQSIPEPQ